MDNEQIELVQNSFAKVAPIRDTTATLFYQRLFEIAPEAKALFKGDMKTQGQMLMGTLAAVVNGLKNLDAVVPVAEKLAVRHVDYGVKAEHYKPVGRRREQSQCDQVLATALRQFRRRDTKQRWPRSYLAANREPRRLSRPAAIFARDSRTYSPT